MTSNVFVFVFQALITNISTRKIVSGSLDDESATALIIAIIFNGFNLHLLRNLYQFFSRRIEPEFDLSDVRMRFRY